MKYPHTKGSVSLYFSLEHNVCPKLSMTQRQEKTLLKEKDHVRELQKQLKMIQLQLKPYNALIA